MSAYIVKKSFYCLLILASGGVSIFLYLALSAPSNVQAGTIADCNARGQRDNCREEVTNKCGSKSGDEKSRCIDTVLSGYTFVGLGAGSVKNCPIGSSGDRCLGNLPKVDDSPNQVRRALSIVFGIAAGVALIALLIAAFNYATAGTDIEKTSRSKRSIITALMGLVIAVAAQAIVLTVLGQL